MYIIQTILFFITITAAITAMAEQSGYDCKTENDKTICKPRVFSQPATPEIKDTPQPSPSTTPQVEVYYAGWDPISMKALDFFRTHHIVVNAHDIEQDPKTAAIKRNLAPNFNGIPLVIINGAVIYGFDEQKYLQALNIGVIKPPQ